MQKLNIKNQNCGTYKNHPAAAGYHNFDFCVLIFDFQKGFGMIELIIVTAIITTALTGFLQAGILATRLLHTEKESLEATMLTQEGMEAVRSVRDESWTNNIAPLANGTTYYPIVINSKWMLSTSNPGLINGLYTRHVTFDQVTRDSTDNIAPTGTVDANTKKVSVIVNGGSQQVQIDAYLTNFQEQLSLPTEAKVISYEEATTDTDIISFPSNDAGDGDPAQSFTTPSTGVFDITRVDALLRRSTATPSDIYAELRATPTGTILGTSNLINASTITTTSAAWVEFRFSPEVSLANSTAYYIRLASAPSSTTSDSESQGSLDWVYFQTPSSPYSGGVARRYIEHLGPLDTGQQLDQYDFGFRVYALQ